MWQHVKKGVSGDANRVLDNSVLLFGWGSLKRKLIAYLHEMMANPWGVNSKNMQQTFVELKNELTNAEGLPKDFMKKFTQLDRESLFSAKIAKSSQFLRAIVQKSSQIKVFAKI